MDKNSKKEKDDRKRQQISKMKIGFIRVVIIGLFIFLVGRVAYIKIAHGEEYERIAVIQATSQGTEQTISATRGDILGRNGEILAKSNTYYNVFIDNRQINTFNEQRPSANIYTELPIILNEDLGIDLELAKSYIALDESGTPVYDNNYKVIKEEITYTELEQLLDDIDEKGLTGVYYENEMKRVYPYNNMAAQTLGFIRGDNGDSSWGLESYYNEELTGTNGRSFISYDENGDVVDNQIDAIPGNNIVTTIDVGMQEFTDQTAIKYYDEGQADAVSIIVMDPNTGEILAMSEAPSFNNNDPSNLSLISNQSLVDKYNESADDEKGEIMYTMWRNFAVSDTYEPGSVYKPVVAASALEESLVSHDEVFFCPGYKVFSDGTTVRCWHLSGHGEQTMGDGIMNSCNVVFMDIAEEMGRDEFYTSQRNFGYGSYTGIDLPAEENGILNSVDKINEVELGTGGMGQGFNSTLIQNITAIAAIANGGNLYQPYIVSQIIDNDGNVIKNIEPRLNKKVISEEVADVVTGDMIKVVEEGTGTKAGVSGYSIAGKSGTAEQGTRDKGLYSLSFVGFLPADDPEYIAMGVIHHSQSYVENNFNLAVPMMGEVFDYMVSYYNVPPANEDIITSNTSDKLAANYIDQNVVDVIDDINGTGYNYEVIGDGNIVINQIPTPNSIIEDNGTYWLTLDSDGTEELKEVPDLTGMELENALTLLEREGFRGVVNEVANTETFEEVSEGIVDTEEVVEEVDTNEENTSDNTYSVKHEVIGQMPEPGAMIPMDTQISLIVKEEIEVE